MTIELAQKVRYGINPSISALAVIIVALTVTGALLNEAYKRRKAVKAGLRIKDIARTPRLPGFLARNPAAVALVLLAVGFVGTIVYAQQYSPAQCKAVVLEQKHQQAEERRQEMLKQLEERRRKAAEAAGEQPGTPAPSGPSNPNTGAFGDVFNPGNLDGKEDAPAQPESNANPNAGAFGGVFAPGNLNDDAGQSQAPEDAPAPGAFGDVFAPQNLETDTNDQ